MRYFVEVCYKGTRYAGYQIQQNAKTIQGEVEKALFTVMRFPVTLTGSSRTDSGVHAKQNFFHFDLDIPFNNRNIYNLNAILPNDIVIRRIFPVSDLYHCRFSAISREYKYFISTERDPFASDVSWFYPYKVDLTLLQAAVRP